MNIAYFYENYLLKMDFVGKMLLVLSGRERKAFLKSQPLSLGTSPWVAQREPLLHTWQILKYGAIISIPLFIWLLPENWHNSHTLFEIQLKFLPTDYFCYGFEKRDDCIQTIFFLNIWKKIPSLVLETYSITKN